MTARRKILLALAFLAPLHGAIALAGYLAPYDFAEQHRDYPYAPPAHIHWSGLRPFVYRLASTPSGDYAEDRSQRYPVRFGLHGRLVGVDPPATLFLLGTDSYGRDILSRVLYGGRVSLAAGLGAAALALGLGLLIGALAGYCGGWPDQILMRSGELVMALPWLYLLLAVRACLPLHIGPIQAFALLIAIVGGIGWVRPARLVRGVVLSGKERGFVLAARGFGASGWYLLRRHVLPLTSSVVLTQATILIPRFVLAEVSLSFLGLGIGEPIPSWGNMLAEARQYHAMVSHAWVLAPGLAAIPLMLGYLALADALAENSR